MTRFCTAQHSKCQPIFVKLFRYLFSFFLKDVSPARWEHPGGGSPAELSSSVVSGKVDEKTNPCSQFYFQNTVSLIFPKSCLEFANFDDNPSEFQHLLRKRPKYVRFLNFLRFRNGNCRIFQKMIFQKLEKI